MKQYYLHLSFKAGANMWDIDGEIRDLLGPPGGSGCGFGERDINYYFNNLNSLRAAVRKVRKMPRKIKCRAYDVSTLYDEKPVSLKGIK